MGVLKFKIPANLPPEDIEELARSSISGAQDYMPYASEVAINGDHMVLRRHLDESGLLAVPWDVNGAGRLMFLSATLMERDQPYHLGVEIARGKLNQLRGQVSDWEQNGLAMPSDVIEQIHRATLTFGKAAVHAPEADRCAQTALRQGCAAADRMARTYIDHLLSLRHERHPRLNTVLGCRLNGIPERADAVELLKRTCNAVWIPFRWAAIEPEENAYCWEQIDALVHWAVELDRPIIGGPLLDFYGADWPDWLWQEQLSLANLASLFCRYVETVVDRYKAHITTWYATSSSNLSPGLSIGDEELLWLTLRAAEALREINPAFQVIVGIAQPWGEYLADEERTHSPFAFADTLVRTGLKLAALDLEMVMGVAPRGSYCRDLLDSSRILDLYALLGVPLQVTLGYPSHIDTDPQADFRLNVGAGRWREGLSLANQADWARAFAALAVCKPYVRNVCWVHLNDARPHEFPNCGLLDGDENPKPALDELSQIRAEHLQ